MTWQPLTCSNGPHELVAGETVLLHNIAAEGEPARLVCHACWCFGAEGHVETRRAHADAR